MALEEECGAGHAGGLALSTEGPGVGERCGELVNKGPGCLCGESSNGLLFEMFL